MIQRIFVLFSGFKMMVVGGIFLAASLVLMLTGNVILLTLHGLLC